MNKNPLSHGSSVLIDSLVAVLLGVGSLLALVYQGGDRLSRALYFHYWDREVAALHAAALVLIAIISVVSSLTRHAIAKKAARIGTCLIAAVLFVKLDIWIAAWAASIDTEHSYVVPNMLTLAVALCIGYIFHRNTTSPKDYEVIVSTFAGSLLVAATIFLGLIHQPA